MSAARSRRANDKHNHLQRTGGNFDKAAAAATLNQRLS